MRSILFVLFALSLSACNSVYMKPHSLDTSKTIYTPRGGFSMKRTVKQSMEERGYQINVGSLQKIKESDPDDTEVFLIPNNVRYAVRVTERKEILRPLWCVFNGFWWWNFSMSITDKTTSQEILSWRGRGCANSSVKRLNDILDELEMEKPAPKPRVPRKTKPKDINDGLIILAKPTK